MRTSTIVAVAVAASTALLTGCATKATIKNTIGVGSPFCTDLGSFATANVALTDAAAETRTALLQLLPPVRAQLQKLENEAPAADTVNTKPVRADIATLVGVYDDLIGALQNPGTTVAAAVASVNAKEGRAATDAANRLDDYAATVCKVSATPVSTAVTAATSSTGSPVGPTAPAVSTSSTAPTSSSTS